MLAAGINTARSVIRGCLAEYGVSCRIRVVFRALSNISGRVFFRVSLTAFGYKLWLNLIEIFISFYAFG